MTVWWLSAAACPIVGLGGGWGHGHGIIKINSDGTLKRVHTEVSGLSSSDDEYTKSEKRSKVTSSNWPRFLIISSTEDGALTKLSLFAVQKAIVGLAGEPKSVKKIKIGL